jgi:hypothetical protein
MGDYKMNNLHDLTAVTLEESVIDPSIFRELDVIIRDHKRMTDNFQYRGKTLIQQIKEKSYGKLQCSRLF